ncbi:hypothetical protein [Lutibaculum baratangense]|nr:hypothetical protein [Lutibaculum baratangense]
MPDGDGYPSAPQLVATTIDGNSLADCPAVVAVALRLHQGGGYIDTALSDQQQLNAARRADGPRTAGGGAGIKF